MQYLSKKDEIRILGIDVQEPHNTGVYSKQQFQFIKLDMLDESRLTAIIKDFQPDGVIHLASLSSVDLSWKKPIECFKNNTTIFLNLLESVRHENKSCRILSVGSSEEYGNIELSDLPLTEQNSAAPTSPYGVARASQEMLSRIYISGYGLDIVSTRSFNHIGPGQDKGFFIPDIASQIVEIKYKKEQNSVNEKAIIRTGDLSVIRDFTDVRDVVKAYWLLINRGEKGEIDNVCSGNGYKLAELIEKMNNLVGVRAAVKTEESRIRPAENRAIIGSNCKIYSRTGWQPSISIEKSLMDVLNYWL